MKNELIGITVVFVLTFLLFVVRHFSFQVGGEEPTAPLRLSRLQLIAAPLGPAATMMPAGCGRRTSTLNLFATSRPEAAARVLRTLREREIR